MARAGGRCPRGLALLASAPKKHTESVEGRRFTKDYRDGTTHVIFEPLDFIARLAALVSKPRVNLTRFHGVFAPKKQTLLGK